MIEELEKVGDVSDIDIEVEEVLEELKKPLNEKAIQKIPIRDNIERLCALTAEDFVRYIDKRLRAIKIPVYKVVIPCGAIGANYYIVEGVSREEKDTIVFFRGTYGYGGQGPHESAFVETYFNKILGIKMKILCGDYLLTLLRII